MASKRTDVVIFGGTSEGRELAECAAAQRLSTVVSVVSSYGEELVPESAFVRVRQGELDRSAMEGFLRAWNPKLVLDATHPYARVVSSQVRELCQKLGLSCYRVLREQTEGTDCREQTTPSDCRHEMGVWHVSSCDQAAELLKRDERPVLLTTGSRELEAFTKDPGVRDRLYVRVLPAGEALEKCERLGIAGSRIMAMQGPFSVELNAALLKQAGAGWLVTKESGSRGGYQEKLEAARQTGASVIVVDRPKESEGISLEAAKQLLSGKGRASQERQQMLSLIGMGMGGGGQLTLEGAEALRTSEAVLGASRMLADVQNHTRAPYREAVYQPREILAWVRAHPQVSRIAVVYSGDTGFYSGAAALIKECRKEAFPVRIYPGISSVSSLCAMAGRGWENLYLASVHGRDCDIAGLLRRHSRVFLLLDGKHNLSHICRLLTEAGYGDAFLTVGSRMGYSDEQLLQGRAAELAEIQTDALSAVIIEAQNETNKE